MNNKPDSIDQILSELIFSIFMAIIVGLTIIVPTPEYCQYKKNISFDEKLVEHLDFNPLVSFDANMLCTIVRNLISNAIKFSPENRKINVTTEKQGDFLMLSIADNGVGMDKAKQKSIFVLNKSESFPGTKGEHGTVVCVLLAL